MGNPALTVDILVIKNDSILLIKRKNDPYKGYWAMPGGFVEYGESLKHAAARELLEETGIKISPQNLYFSEVLDDPERDPRQHVVTVAYYAFVPNDTEAIASDDAAECKWVPIMNFRHENLAFDHELIIANALQFVSFITRIGESYDNSSTCKSL